MGICASVASSDIHETNETFEQEEENAILIEAEAFPDKGLASVYSEQGSKGLNQDTAIICQGFGLADGSFYGVFDGHGKNGHIASKLVRNRLPRLLLDQRKALASTKQNNRIVHEESLNVGLDKWMRAYVDAFKVMDKELKLQNSDLSSSGTTAVTIIKQDQDLVIANLGDSRAILGTTSDSGELVAVQLTTDLKPGLAEEEERIKNSNGRVFALKEEPHIQRVWLPNEEFPGLAMSRAFGDFQLKNYGLIAIPEISYRRVDEKDKFLVLATDGVWDVLSNDDVASIVWASTGEDTAAKAVVDAAAAAWKHRFPSSKRDDCTVACLFLHEKQPLIT